MNVLEFRSPLGESPLFFAPKDSPAVEVTVTAPTGRQVRVTGVTATDPEHDAWGERWCAQIPAWALTGTHIVLFDQDGTDTVYHVDVYDPREG